jgi:hypothetical protein
MIWWLMSGRIFSIMSPSGQGIFLTEKELSEYIRISIPCLKHWRSIGYGPSFFRYKGKSIRYGLCEIYVWIERSVVEPGKEEDCGAGKIVDGVFEIFVYGGR